MKVIKQLYWYFSPTNSKGKEPKYKYGRIEIIVAETSLFEQPTIAMSDIHSQTPELVVILDEFVNLNKFVVLACGDMAGGFVRGTDGAPTPEYEFLNDRSLEFYFVQGNHDQPSKGNAELKLRTKSGKQCNIKDGLTTKSLIGTIGGVNGIISDKEHTYKMSADTYHEKLKQALTKRPKILMTHDTPSITTLYENGERYIGNASIFDIVNQYKPKVHFYGHCHHPQFHNLINGVNYINLDGRVIIFVSPGKTDGLFKKELVMVHSPNALAAKAVNPSG